MENRRGVDLTQGDILKKLLVVALPIMGTQLMQMAYNLVDMFFLGRVGADAVAASGTAGMYMWLAAGPMLVGRMGAEIGVAQFFGRGNMEEAKDFARCAVRIALALGLALGAFLALLNRPLIGFFGIQEQNVAQDAQRYLITVSIGVPFTYVTAAIVGAFNASGNSRLPFIVNSAGLVMNMVLDPVFIFALGQGVTGAAVATVLSQCAVTAMMLFAFKRTRGRPFEQIRLSGRVYMRHVKMMLRWSVPVALESVFFTSMSIITSSFVSAYGAGALAVTKVGSQIESLSWLVGGGYGSAVTAFVGQNYGASQRARIDRCVRISMGVMTVWGLIITAILCFAGGALFLLFLPDASLLTMAVDYLRIMAVCQVIMCLEGVATGTFRGCGQTHQPAVASVASNVLRVGFAWWLGQTPLGVNGVFWGITLSTIVRGVWILAWYYRVRDKIEPQAQGQ